MSAYNEIVESIQKDAGLADSISLGSVRAAINLIANGEPVLAAEILSTLEVLLAVRVATET